MTLQKSLLASTIFWFCDFVFTYLSPRTMGVRTFITSFKIMWKAENRKKEIYLQFFVLLGRYTGLVEA